MDTNPHEVRDFLWKRSLSKSLPWHSRRRRRGKGLTNLRQRGSNSPLAAALETRSATCHSFGTPRISDHPQRLSSPIKNPRSATDLHQSGNRGLRNDEGRDRGCEMFPNRPRRVIVTTRRRAGTSRRRVSEADWRETPGAHAATPPLSATDPNEGPGRRGLESPSRAVRSKRFTPDRKPRP